ncbi:acetylxylan esterase, partial [bacterium]
MPLLDLSVEALYQYQGRNPRPAGFDTFWNDALSELESVPPRVELVRHELAAPFAECFHLTFDGVDGARQYAKFLRPKNIETPVPCVLEFHGYSGSSGDWVSKLPFVGRGQAIASLDCRGQGGRSQDNSRVTGNTHSGHIIRGLDDALNGHPEALYYRQMFLDTAQLARAVAHMPEIDGTRLGARGGSQGGALTLACAALAPIKKAAAKFPFLCDYKRVWEMDLAQGAYAEIKTWFRYFDPRHEREDEVW